MQRFTLTKADGWVLVSTASVCRLQVLAGWHPGAVFIHVGATMPSMDDPYFEVVQGEYFIKTTDTDNVYVYAAYANRVDKGYPAVITVSDQIDGAASGGSSGGGTTDGLTDAQLRASEVPVTDVAITNKLEELRLQLTTLLGSSANLETLNDSTNTLLTNIQGYVDQLEALTTSVGANTSNLTTLLTQLGLNTDQVESIMQQVADKLPSGLGKQTSTDSLSVTLSSDDAILPTIQALTKPTDTQIVTQLQSTYNAGYQRVTTSGTVSGANSITISNVGTASGTVGGASILDVGETVSFEAQQNGVIADLAYDATGTTFVIVTLTVA